ncbi:putative glutamyl-tRNA(Gln) amidotransferase subunit A, mitochondrial-like [Apostichopus japonicus]|uniref:Putative glutamyl-tRNA(Gln) amidotransferase subunit A, mitochondrial-like n=1 Tax=Stichopus japonicus TaxID=307972 RepID=A0A2G8JIH8_STIJA|nr:putative glutamyl-tRNA(Gln) amidotransferase subunit A, mitochondrial-like [Apostichopus japonicus]
MQRSNFVAFKVCKHALPGLYSEASVKLPSLPQLEEIARNLDVDVKEDELKEYQELMQSLCDGFSIIDKLPEPGMPVKFPRTPGYRPKKENNKLNGWCWRVDIKGSKQGKLAGMTVGIKDNVGVAGAPMTVGCAALEGYYPEYDATVVTSILDAGGNIIGKTSCENLCVSGSSFTSHSGPTLNFHNPLHSAGGSSSGSATLVKVLILQSPVVMAAPPLIECMYHEILWYLVQTFSSGIGSGHYGFYPTSFTSFAAKSMRARMNDSSHVCKLIFMFGEYLKSKYPGQFYSKGQNCRRLLIAEYQEALKEYDVVAMPTIPFTAHKLPAQVLSVTEYVHKAFENPVNTMATNLTGMPSITVNAGFIDGLPVGAMFTAKKFDEVTLLKVAKVFEMVNQA